MVLIITLIFSPNHLTPNENSHSDTIIRNSHTISSLRSSLIPRLHSDRDCPRVHRSRDDVRPGSVPGRWDSVDVGRGRDCLAAKHRSVGSWHSADVCISVCGVWDRVGGGENDMSGIDIMSISLLCDCVLHTPANKMLVVLGPFLSFY